MFKRLFQKKSVQLKNQIELCVSNRIYDSEEIEEILQRQDVDVFEVGCNSRCEICDEQFYAIVNGEVVRATTAHELRVKIDEELAVNSFV